MQDKDAAFEDVVATYYQDLYRFAFSLVHNEPDAIDLTQQTFYRYATKGHLIQDRSKVKSWLFTVLKNDFLDKVRRSKKFQHVELEAATPELPPQETAPDRAIDRKLAVEALSKVDENYRTALSMFYLKGLSYKEIAEALEVPIGTVMSRLSRGKNQLKIALHANV